MSGIGLPELQEIEEELSLKNPETPDYSIPKIFGFSIDEKIGLMKFSMLIPKYELTYCFDNVTISDNMENLDEPRKYSTSGNFYDKG